MENAEKKFKELMKREGMDELIRPRVYIAQLPYPDPERPTILGKFRTSEERKKWYDEVGRGFEIADVGEVQFIEGPAEEDEIPEEKISKEGAGKQFDELIKREKLEGVAGKEGYVFKVMYKARGEKDFKLFSEADTADEARDLLDVIKADAKEEDYQIEIRYEPKKSGQ